MPEDRVNVNLGSYSIRSPQRKSFSLDIMKLFLVHHNLIKDTTEGAMRRIQGSPPSCSSSLLNSTYRFHRVERCQWRTC